MDILQLTLLAAFAIGIILIIYSIADFQSVKEEKFYENSSDFFLEKKLDAMGVSINEADTVLSELNDTTKNVFKELDQKYHELLFLYNLIDDKKKEFSQEFAAKISEGAADTVTQNARIPGETGGRPESGLGLDITVDEYTRRAYKNPRLKQIMELKQRGMGVQQIAKELNMGQGEVSLIMGLFSNADK